MTRFTSSVIDPRKLSMLPHQIAHQHPGRRRHVHGPIQPMDRPRDPSAKVFIWLAVIVAVFFALQLLRLPLLGASAASVASSAPHASAQSAPASGAGGSAHHA